MVKWINKFRGNVKYVLVCIGIKFIFFVVFRVCCILDFFVCIVYFFLVFFLNFVVIRSDFVFSDDRFAVIGFCSVFCLFGVVLVGVLLVVYFKLEIKIILFKFCELKILYSYILIYVSCFFVLFIWDFLGLFCYFCNYFDKN